MLGFYFGCSLFLILEGWNAYRATSHISECFRCGCVLLTVASLFYWGWLLRESGVCRVSGLQFVAVCCFLCRLMSTVVFSELS